MAEEKDCICADPENCTERVPGYRCKKDCMPRVQRSELQREADRIDCDLYRIICQLENLGERIRIVGPTLRGVANQLHSARPALRRLMHQYDRERTK